MSLTAEQCKAIKDTKKILQDSGVADPSSFPTDVFASSLQSLANDNLVTRHSFPLPLFSYISFPPSFPATGHLKVTCNSSSAVDAVIDHPIGAIVEYPQSGSQPGEAIANRFAINPSDYVNPRNNLQYSTGKGRSGHANIKCFIISQGNSPGEAVPSYQFKGGCKLSSDFDNILYLFMSTLIQQVTQSSSVDSLVLPIL